MITTTHGKSTTGYLSGPTPFTPSITVRGSDQLTVSYGIVFGPKYPNTSWHQIIVPTLGGLPLVNWQTDPTTAWPSISASAGLLCIRLRRYGLQFDEAIIDIYDPINVVDSALYTYIPLANITSVVVDGESVFVIDRYVVDNIMYQPSWRWPFECVPYTNASGDEGVLIQYGLVYEYTTSVPTIDIAGTPTALSTNILSNNLVTSNSATHDIYLVCEVDDSDEWEPIYIAYRIESATSIPSDTSTLKHFLLAQYNPITRICTQARHGHFRVDRDGQSGSAYYLTNVP